MKIGIDSSRYGHDQATGVEWYSWHIINNLLKIIGSEDEIFLYSREPLEIAAAKNIVLKARKLWTLRALSAEIKKNPPDVLFVPSHVLPLRLPARSIVTIHDTAFRRMPEIYSFAEYQYLNWSTKKAVKNATTIIVPSEATKKDLIRDFGCAEYKIVVIHHGFDNPESVEDEAFEQSDFLKSFGIDSSLKYILFVGRLETKKNLPRLIEAFGEFLINYPDYKLVLAGKRGVGFDKILKAVQEFDLNDKVVMPGYISEEEKAMLFQHCQFFAFPSLYEGFGLPILEAFYYGKPILCSDCSSMPEVAGEAAKYVDPEVISSIKNGLEFLADGGEDVDELVSKGRERLKDFSWQKAAEKTLKVLHGQ